MVKEIVMSEQTAEDLSSTGGELTEDVLEQFVSRLATYCTNDEAKRWLFSSHALLDGRRPADLIAERRTDDVLRLIDQLDSAAAI